MDVNEPIITQTEPEKPKKRSKLRILLITMGITFGVLVLAAVLIPLLFEKQIKNIFIAELNKSLATEVDISQDNIHLSLFKSFPNAAVVFNNVGMRESKPTDGNAVRKADKNFLQAEEISLVFNVWDIFRGNYTIKHIKVKNGYCHLITDKKGNINYKFWKDSDGESSSNFAINLEKVNCENIDFQYLDYKYQQQIELMLHACTFSGNLSSDSYAMSIDGDVLSKRIKISNTSYLINKEANIATEINVDVPNDKYTFENGKITIDKNLFLLNGFISLQDEDYYDLSINGGKINLEGLMLLLPGNISNNLTQYKSKGKIDFATTIKGNYTKTKNPAIDITFDVEKGSIAHQQFGGELSNMQFTGKYSNGVNHNGGTSSITITNFSATQNKQPVTLQLAYKNFVNPYIDLQLDGIFPASLIIPMALSNATEVEGTISLNNINIKGAIKTLSSELATSQPTGSIAFNDVEFEINKQKVQIPAGKAVVRNNEIILNGLTLNIGESDLKAEIVINNWIQQVFPATITPALNINGDIIAEKINLNELILAFSPKEASSVNSNELEIDTPIENEGNYNFSGNLNLRCSEFIYDKVNFTDISSEIKLVPGLIVVNNLIGNAMTGKFNMNATFRELINGDVVLQVTGTLNSIDVAQLFDQFDNFGQTTLTNKNLKGKISANLYALNVRFDKDFVLDESYLYSLCDMKIEDGELIDYKPLESLSSFVKISDLRHIKFSTLENKIEIKNRVITLPAMQINSSAVDMYVSGKHSFDDVIDYQLKLSMADVMVRKFLGGNKQKDDYEESTNGGVNVYISMTGTVNDPVIKYNKKEAKQKLEDSGLEEHRFIDIFKRDPDETLFENDNSKSTRPKDTKDTEVDFIEFEEE